MKETLYIVMPAYNEEANIRTVVAEWYPMLKFGSDRSRMVISDGGSRDRTLEILWEMQQEYPQLEVLPRPGTDHGTKVILLYKYAISHGADWIFQTDSDGQTLPSEFPSFWNIRGDYDALMGNRKKRGDGAGRRFVEIILRFYLLLFFGTMVPDANAPFRLMRSETVAKYIDLLPDDFNLPNAFLAACFKKFRERVKYMVVSFYPRQGGKNYMNPRRILRIGVQSIRNFYYLRKKLKTRNG